MKIAPATPESCARPEVGTPPRNDGGGNQPLRSILAPGRPDPSTPPPPPQSGAPTSSVRGGPAP
jgi:hypothetical protein